MLHQPVTFLAAFEVQDKVLQTSLCIKIFMII